MTVEAPMVRIDDVRELAEKVMGWEVTKTWQDGFDIKCPTRFRCYFWDGVQDDYTWNPYADANAAIEVVEAMDGRGYRMRAEKTEHGFYVRFMQTLPDESRFHKGQTFCGAICTAALAAIREGQ